LLTQDKEMEELDQEVRAEVKIKKRGVETEGYRHGDEGVHGGLALRAEEL
jgi:hypothetical protein